MGTRSNLAFVLPHLRPGGAEVAVVNWLGAIDRTAFAPLVLLKRRDGALLDRVPRDVPVIEVGGARAPAFTLRLRRALDRHCVDIAYSATSAANLALAATSLLPGRPVRRFLSEHTSPDAYAAEAKWAVLRRGITRYLYPKAERILVPTQAIADTLSSNHPGLSVCVVPNPVVNLSDTSVWHRPADHDATFFHVLAAGRLVPAKGFDLLIEAAGLLRDRGVNVRMTICGEGPLRAQLQATIDRLGLQALVTLAGYCGDLPARMRDADAFVLSSRREGFGNVIVEAMAQRLPVIATRLPGPSALIRDGSTGLLVAPENPSYLADAIARLAASPAEAKRLAKAAVSGIDRYDIAASARILSARLRSSMT